MTKRNPSLREFRMQETYAFQPPKTLDGAKLMASELLKLSGHQECLRTIVQADELHDVVFSDADYINMICAALELHKTAATTTQTQG